MMGLIVAALTLTLVSSAQALPFAPPPPDDTLLLVREACPAGMHRLDGVCVRGHAPSSSSIAKQRKTILKPAYGSAGVAEPMLLPEAARLKEMQKYWPNQPLCDKGGYRIRPCYMGDGGSRP
jgi:hypothetical protein